MTLRSIFKIWDLRKKIQRLEGKVLERKRDASTYEPKKSRLRPINGQWAKANGKGGNMRGKNSGRFIRSSKCVESNMKFPNLDHFKA